MLYLFQKWCGLWLRHSVGLCWSLSQRKATVVYFIIFLCTLDVIYFKMVAQKNIVYISNKLALAAFCYLNIWNRFIKSKNNLLCLQSFTKMANRLQAPPQNHLKLWNFSCKVFYLSAFLPAHNLPLDSKSLRYYCTTRRTRRLQMEQCTAKMFLDSVLKGKGRHPNKHTCVSLHHAAKLFQQVFTAWGNGHT